jgi:hypothetical protein
MTACGTVGAVVAALGIAIWSERRTDTGWEHRRGQVRQIQDGGALAALTGRVISPAS